MVGTSIMAVRQGCSSQLSWRRILPRWILNLRKVYLPREMSNRKVSRLSVDVRRISILSPDAGYS